MITMATLTQIENNGGLTLKNGEPITYKSGWQVATEGMQTTSISEVMEMVISYNGNCGLWLENGIWYVDKSHRVNTKREAMEIGRKCHQISVLKWSTMTLAYC